MGSALLDIRMMDTLSPFCKDSTTFTATDFANSNREPSTS